MFIEKKGIYVNSSFTAIIIIPTIPNYLHELIRTITICYQLLSGIIKSVPYTFIPDILNIILLSF